MLLPDMTRGIAVMDGYGPVFGLHKYHGQLSISITRLGVQADTIEQFLSC